jgi:protein-S-isoprenylcysteine O-methyltransferase Ste14
MVVPQLVIFGLLGGAKLVVESYAGRHINRGGNERSQTISKIFIFQGIVTPLLILAENLLMIVAIPLAICLIFALIELLTMVLRYAAIRALGRFYSVHIRICADHVLVQEGVYRYLRHPIYLVGIIETFSYPLACGAPVTALLISLPGIPLILKRRRDEEKMLAEKFGSAYSSYIAQTWF